MTGPDLRDRPPLSTSEVRRRETRRLIVVTVATAVVIALVLYFAGAFRRSTS